MKELPGGVMPVFGEEQYLSQQQPPGILNPE